MLQSLCCIKVKLFNTKQFLHIYFNEIFSVIKINVRTTEAVRPVLQYLFAASEEITSPVILHADVFRSPRSVEV